MKRIAALVGASVIGGGALIGPACRSGDDDAAPGNAPDTGEVQLMLAEVPEDTLCLKVRVEGLRTIERSLDLTPGQAQAHRLALLPAGLALFSGEAFNVACSALTPATVASWVTEQPVMAKVVPPAVTSVLLKLIRNGRVDLSVDFDDGAPPLPPPPAGTACGPGGVRSSQPSYLVPAAAGIYTRAILTVGDSANNKPDGTPYRMVGIPDGAGGFDNGDGTFTFLLNHELSNNVGIPRAHGSRGAFVSKWTIRKCDLAVLHGEDLIKQVVLWDRTASAYATPATGVTFGRLCGAELAERSAFYDSATEVGYPGRLFTNGEEIGTEGRAFAHAVDGTSYELPRMGRYTFENVVPHPDAGANTIVVGLDDSGGGQVYVYVGTKTNAGSPVERAGLTNGTLYGVKVTGFPTEIPATGIPSGTPFEMHSFGNVENMTGAQLETASNTALVSKFQRPEDGNWDPSNRNDFYWVSTADFGGQSRLWRLRFGDIANPAAGGRIDMLVQSSAGPRMMDNMTVSRRGHVYLQEDTGSQDWNGKIWRFEIASGALLAVVEHDPARFVPGGASFLTRDEESSGMFEASDILGPGWFLAVDQAHRGNPDPELVEYGQIVAIYDRAAAP